jgi:hypothetical protein
LSFSRAFSGARRIPDAFSAVILSDGGRIQLERKRVAEEKQLRKMEFEG